MDYLVYGFGVIIILAAILVSYISGMKTGKARVRTEYKDHISLRGLSLPAREKLEGHYQTTLVWDEKRGPNRHLFKSVHYD